MRRKQACALVLAGILLLLCVPARADSGGDSALQAFADTVEAHAYNLDTEFSISCGWQLRNELKKTSSVGEGTEQLTEIMTRAGCYAYSVAYAGDHVRIEDVCYYPGWKILRRYETGTAGLLADREQRTLEEALALAANATGSDLEKERYIYDALCERVTYEYEDNLPDP